LLFFGKYSEFTDCGSNFSLSICYFFRTFLVSARKVPQRSRVKGRFAQMRPLYNPPPHRHPAFKNVPIFERFHAANLKSAPQSPLKIGTFSVGGGQKRREWGPGRGGAPRSES